MPGQYDRYRDEEGRFTGRSRGERQWYDHADRGRDDRGPRFGRGNDRPRDEQGRFTESDERGGYYGQRGYEEDRYRPSEDYGRYGRGYDERYDSGRGEEGYSRGRGDRDEYRRYGSEESYRGERGRVERERDEFGRFTSDDDYQGRGGRGYDDDRESRGRGWFGDPEGHAEAARQRGRGGSRFEGYDDDRGGRGGLRGRGSQGRGDDHRGWFGDSRGHATAARLGWRHRQG